MAQDRCEPVETGFHHKGGGISEHDGSCWETGEKVLRCAGE